MQLLSDGAVSLSSKGPEVDLFYLKRSRTWEQREMISLMLSPLWTGSLMMGVFKTILQMIPKGMASEQVLSAARSRQVLRTHDPPFHCWASLLPSLNAIFPTFRSLSPSQEHSHMVISVLGIPIHTRGFSSLKFLTSLQIYFEKFKIQRTMPKKTPILSIHLYTKLVTVNILLI